MQTNRNNTKQKCWLLKQRYKQSSKGTKDGEINSGWGDLEG